MAAASKTSWQTIPEMLEASADRFGDQVAVVDGSTTLTYSQLVERVHDFAAALVRSGVGKGDRVSIWAFNSVEWIISCFGILEAGAVLVPINTRFKGPEAAEVLLRSRARVLVTVTDFLGTDYVAMLASAGVDLPELETIVVAHGAASGSSRSWADFLALADGDSRAEVRARRRALERDDVSDILFTSGTTGVPKGVVMTHGRSLYCGTDWVTMTGLGPADRYLMIPPYFSQFGYKAGLLASVAAGATMLPEAVFDVDRVLARVADQGVTVLPGPPTLYQSVLDDPSLGRYDLSSLRVAVTGSSDTPVELVRRMHEELPFSLIISGYGMTEGGTSASTRQGDEFEAIAKTVGRARPGYDLSIADAQGRDCPAGDVGEILFRGPAVMKEYLDDPETTAKTLSADGWLRSGDLGMLDDAGRLRIVGRLKDMFIVGGFNAYPPEIENALLRHPAIRQAAVIGVPDYRLGEVGRAFVVLHTDAVGVGAEDIIAWCREQMANYKVPRVVDIVTELPLNASGKVRKELLRELAAAAAT